MVHQSKRENHTEKEICMYSFKNWGGSKVDSSLEPSHHSAHFAVEIYNGGTFSKNIFQKELCPPSFGQFNVLDPGSKSTTFFAEPLNLICIYDRLFFRRFGGNVGEWTFRKIEFWQISWVLAAKTGWVFNKFLEFLKNFLEYWSKLAIKACGMYFAVVICSFPEDMWHLWLLKELVLMQELPKNWVSDKILLEFWRYFAWVLIKLSFGALEFWSKRRKKSLLYSSWKLSSSEIIVF